MLLKLQKRTLVPAQLIGYFLTLIFGTTILLTTIQLYSDLKPLLIEETYIFNSNAAVVSKNISVFKTLKKDKIYFTNEELDLLKNQDFVKNISAFNSATFRIKAFTEKSGELPSMYSELFFESIPDEYIDVEAEDWLWDSSLQFIPIIVPENYLNLYNFGFAESQSLPVLSKNTISQINFKIRIRGNGYDEIYQSKIVGFSSKINSILVPEPFLLWANKKYGRLSTQKTNRILIEFKNPSDKKILHFFNEHNYSINKDKLESSKLMFFFKFAMLFVFTIAIVIVVLSLGFIFLSVNLMLHKNKEIILNLYHIGFGHKKLALFYQIVVSTVSITSIWIAVLLVKYIRKFYLKELSSYFDFVIEKNMINTIALGLVLILLAFFYFSIRSHVKKIVLPKV